MLRIVVYVLACSTLTHAIGSQISEVRLANKLSRHRRQADQITPFAQAVNTIPTGSQSDISAGIQPAAQPDFGTVIGDGSAPADFSALTAPQPSPSARAASSTSAASNAGIQPAAFTQDQLAAFAAAPQGTGATGYTQEQLAALAAAQGAGPAPPQYSQQQLAALAAAQGAGTGTPQYSQQQLAALAASQGAGTPGLSQQQLAAWSATQAAGANSALPAGQNSWGSFTPQQLAGLTASQGAGSSLSLPSGSANPAGGTNYIDDFYTQCIQKCGQSCKADCEKLYNQLKSGGLAAIQNQGGASNGLLVAKPPANLNGPPVQGSFNGYANQRRVAPPGYPLPTAGANQFNGAALRSQFSNTPALSSFPNSAYSNPYASQLLAAANGAGGQLSGLAGQSQLQSSLSSLYGQTSGLLGQTSSLGSAAYNPYQSLYGANSGLGASPFGQYGANSQYGQQYGQYGANSQYGQQYGQYGATGYPYGYGGLNGASGYGFGGSGGWYRKRK